MASLPSPALDHIKLIFHVLREPVVPPRSTSNRFLAHFIIVLHLRKLIPRPNRLGLFHRSGIQSWCLTCLTPQVYMVILLVNVVSVWTGFNARMFMFRYCRRCLFMFTSHELQFFLVFFRNKQNIRWEHRAQHRSCYSFCADLLGAWQVIEPLLVLILMFGLLKLLYEWLQLF